jgi:hypothetical protein
VWSPLTPSLGVRRTAAAARPPAGGQQATSPTAIRLTKTLKVYLMSRLPPLSLEQAIVLAEHLSGLLPA